MHIRHSSPEGSDPAAKQIQLSPYSAGMDSSILQQSEVTPGNHCARHRQRNESGGCNLRRFILEPRGMQSNPCQNTALIAAAIVQLRDCPVKASDSATTTTHSDDAAHCQQDSQAIPEATGLCCDRRCLFRSSGRLLGSTTPRFSLLSGSLASSAFFDESLHLAGSACTGGHVLYIRLYIEPHMHTAMALNFPL